jgi:serine/threonine protein kinase
VRRIGPFEIVRRLESGGMGTLVLARRVGPSGFSRELALKLIHPHLAEEPSFLEMFVREAKLVARIQHPNVVHVEELGQDDGTWFIAMEYVRGGSLANLLTAVGKRGRKLEPSVAVHIACAVADGLHAAHELRDERGTPTGVIHRDVSPHNILVSSTGHVKLIDFGIASVERLERSTGSIQGKLAYMSPEQARGDALDRRADVYALGVVLWEMLTVRRLFHGRSKEDLLARVLNPQAPRVDAIDPAVPSDVADLVAWALEPQAERRPASALALREALAATQSRSVSPLSLGELVLEMLPGAPLRGEPGEATAQPPLTTAPPSTAPLSTTPPSTAPITEDLATRASAVTASLTATETAPDLPRAPASAQISGALASLTVSVAPPRVRSAFDDTHPFTVLDPPPEPRARLTLGRVLAAVLSLALLGLALAALGPGAREAPAASPRAQAPHTIPHARSAPPQRAAPEPPQAAPERALPTTTSAQTASADPEPPPATTARVSGQDAARATTRRGRRRRGSTARGSDSSAPTSVVPEVPIFDDGF